MVILAGLGILATLIIVNRPIALVLIVFDMLDFAGWINPEAWGLPAYFKFKDLEYILLMVTGIVGLAFIPRLRLPRKTAIYRAMVFFALIVSIYILYTLTFQGVSLTFRVARNLLYYTLFFIIPFYIRSMSEVDIALKGFFILMFASSVSHIAQTVFFPIHTLLPYMQSSELADGLVRLWGPSQPFNFIGLPVLFGVYLQRKKTIIAFGICLLASILTFARIHIAYFGISMVVVLLLLSETKLRFSRVIRVLGIISLFYSVVWILLGAYAKEDLVIKTVSDRMADTQTQFKTREGTFFSHIEYAFQAPLLIKYAGGSLLWGLGYQGLPYSNILGGGEIQEEFIPTFNSDNGWAGIIVSMGIIGILVFSFFLITVTKHIFRIARHAKVEQVRILSASLFAFFFMSWFLWFFSALGIWQDSAVVVAVALGLLNRAFFLEIKKPKNEHAIS